MFDFRSKSQNEILNFYFLCAFSVNILFIFLLAKEKQKALFRIPFRWRGGFCCHIADFQCGRIS